MKKISKKVDVIFADSEKGCNFAPAFERDGKQIDRVTEVNALRLSILFYRCGKRARTVSVEITSKKFFKKNFKNIWSEYEKLLNFANAFDNERKPNEKSSLKEFR